MASIVVALYLSTVLDLHSDFFLCLLQMYISYQISNFSYRYP